MKRAKNRASLLAERNQFQGCENIVRLYDGMLEEHDKQQAAKAEKARRTKAEKKRQLVFDFQHGR